MHRIAVTLLALPLFIVVAAFGIGHALSPYGPLPHPSAVASLLLFYALFVYASVALVAIPLLWLFAWWGKVSAWSSALAGTAAALLIPSIPAASQLWDSKLRLSYRLWQFIDLWPFVLLGAASGLAFWLLALRANPIVKYWNQRHVHTVAGSAA